MFTDAFFIVALFCLVVGIGAILLAIFCNIHDWIRSR